MSAGAPPGSGSTVKDGRFTASMMPHRRHGRSPTGPTAIRCLRHPAPRARTVHPIPRTAGWRVSAADHYGGPAPERRDGSPARPGPPGARPDRPGGGLGAGPVGPPDRSHPAAAAERTADHHASPPLRPRVPASGRARRPAGHRHRRRVPAPPPPARPAPPPTYGHARTPDSLPRDPRSGAARYRPPPPRRRPGIPVPTQQRCRRLSRRSAGRLAVTASRPQPVHLVSRPGSTTSRPAVADRWLAGHVPTGPGATGPPDDPTLSRPGAG